MSLSRNVFSLRLCQANVGNGIINGYKHHEQFINHLVNMDDLKPLSPDNAQLDNLLKLSMNSVR